MRGRKKATAALLFVSCLTWNLSKSESDPAAVHAYDAGDMEEDTPMFDVPLDPSEMERGEVLEPDQLTSEQELLMQNGKGNGGTVEIGIENRGFNYYLH